ECKAKACSYLAIAPSTSPLPIRSTPRLLYAIQQFGFRAIVVRQSVSISRYIPLCRDVNNARLPKITAAPAAPTQFGRFNHFVRIVAPAAMSEIGPMLARYW